MATGSHLHLTECYACCTEINVMIPHESGAEAETTCPACGQKRTFAALRDKDTGVWYAEDVTQAETDIIGVWHAEVEDRT